MNHLETNIPNMIKQPGICCIYCGKSYKKRTNLNKHVILCEILDNSRKKRIYDEETIPTQAMMYKILLEFGERFTRLEKKVEELSKQMIVQKNLKHKKINVIQWLNTNIIPDMCFAQIMEKITITKEEAKYLFQHNFIDTLNHIFSKSIYKNEHHEHHEHLEYNGNCGNIKYPIYAFVQKPRKLYIYESCVQGWIEMSKNTLIDFLNKIHLKLFRMLTMYQKEHEKEMNENEKDMMLYHKITVHMMDINFHNNKQIVGKIQNMIYTKIHQDIQFIKDDDIDIDIDRT
jgi:hypothetical protein